MGNREYVKIFLRPLPYKLNCIAKAKKLHHNSFVNEPFVPLDSIKNIVNRKHLAFEIKPRLFKALPTSNVRKAFLTNIALKHAMRQT